MRDLSNNIDLRSATDPYDHATGDAVITTNTVDLQGFDSVVLSFHWGSIADADVSFTAIMYEGEKSDMSDEAAVSDVDLLGTEADFVPLFSDDNELRKIGYTGGMRYIRMKITPADNTGDLLCEGTWILGHPEDAPTTNPPPNAAAPT